MFFSKTLDKTILVIAPHADDETLGCGGAMLKYIQDGFDVHWCVVTSPKEPEYSKDFLEIRKSIINKVKNAYGFKSLHFFDFKPSTLTSSNKPALIKKFNSLYEQLFISSIFVPHRNDAHSDHGIVFDSAVSAAKWFRSRSITDIISYETLSETEFQIRPGDGQFLPNYFVDICDTIERKCQIMSLYSTEVGDFPFPRSEKAIKALSDYRGIQSGFNSAEAFQILKSISK